MLVIIIFMALWVGSWQREVLDRINGAFGRRTIRFDSEALSDAWRMHALLKSPAYTTRWDELARVRAW